jgi:creatinine amidohydrolase
MMHLHPDLVLPKSEWGQGTDNRWKLKAINEKWAWAQRAWSKQPTTPAPAIHSTAPLRKENATSRPWVPKFATYLIELAAADISDLYEKSK